MPETVTDITIDAPADDVWRVLSDFSSYPGWNPLIRRVDGKLDVDATLTVTHAAGNGGDQTNRSTVLLYRPGREIRLRSRPILPGIMDVEHGFKIEPLGPEQVRFVHWKTTSGLLAPIFGGGSGSELRDRLNAMNVALKRQAESGAAADGGEERPVVTAASTSDDQHVSAVGQPA